MGQQLTDYGEEYLLKNDMSTDTLNVGLYDDSTNAMGDTNDVGDITSEPGGAAYAKQSTAFTASDIGGNYGIDNDAQISFDLSDSSTGAVDSWFVTATFQADGDGSPTEHLLCTGSLSQSYTLSNVDTLNIDAGGVGFTVT